MSKLAKWQKRARLTVWTSAMLSVFLPLGLIIEKRIQLPSFCHADEVTRVISKISDKCKEKQSQIYRNVYKFSTQK